MNTLTKRFAGGICAAMILLSEICAAAHEVPTIPEGNAYIPKGVVLKVELTKDLSSKKAKVGDVVPLKLVENLIVNGVIVAPAGSDVKGVVTKAHKAALLGRGGKLEISVVSVAAINGVEIPLQYSQYRHAAGDSGAALVLVPSPLAIAGGIFVTGANVFYHAGLRFDAEILRDVDLKVPLDELAEAMTPHKPHGVSITVK